MTTLLLDAMHHGWKKPLEKKNYDVLSVVDLVNSGEKLKHDYSVIKRAEKDNLLLITSDKECALGCKENNIDHILIGNEEIFELLLSMLKSKLG